LWLIKQWFQEGLIDFFSFEQIMGARFEEVMDFGRPQAGARVDVDNIASFVALE